MPVNQRKVKVHKASYQGKNVKGYDGSEGQWTEAEYRAATRMQAAWRMIKARKQAAEQMKIRQDALLYFSYPIYVVSLVDLIYGTVMTHLSARDLTPSNLLSLVTFGLCLIVFIVDLNRQPPIRFSLTHGVFLVAILYRLSFKASTIDQEIWTLFEGLLSESYAFLVPLITMAFHYTLFITVTSLGSVALTLVSTTSACVHLLFFFQFFDFFFIRLRNFNPSPPTMSLYSALIKPFCFFPACSPPLPCIPRSVYIFFNCRQSDELITMTFLLQQLFMQIVVFLRQSGTTDALIDQAMDNILFPLLHALKLSEFKYNVVKQTDQLADPVYVLQSIARKSIQFDIAQVTALILTPIVISFFTWRDGVFTLEGTGILVHHCNLRLIWIRFLVLLCFYPIGSSLGRWLLEHKMRTTLLGKPTLHGTSRVIGKMRQEARIKQMAKAKAASARRRSVMGARR